MTFDFDAGDFVVVTAHGVRYGHKGRVIDRHNASRQLYSIQFLGNSVGFFDRTEIERIPWEEIPVEWRDGKGFKTISELMES